MITFSRIGLAFSSSYMTILQICYGYFFSVRALILASKRSILAVTLARSVFRLSSTFCSKSVFPLAFASSCVCSDSSSVNVLVNSHPTTEKLFFYKQGQFVTKTSFIYNINIKWRCNVLRNISLCINKYTTHVYNKCNYKIWLLLPLVEVSTLYRF